MTSPYPNPYITKKAKGFHISELKTRKKICRSKAFLMEYYADVLVQSANCKK